MKSPTETQWCRVEELSEELRRLTQEQAALRLEQLAAGGETPTVVTLLGAWHSLPAPAPPLSAGLVIGGNYTLRERIGEGSMGTVWRATQRTVEREVALKILHAGLLSPALRQRAFDEIRALGRLDHPGVVRIFDAGVHEDPRWGGLPYFVMELVEGLPLNRWAAQSGGDLRRGLEVVAAVCEAVQAAHDRRIVHRDLKPANILVRHDGRPVVLDFGIARFVGLTDGHETGVFSGTPQYAAPEQHLGRDLDFRSGESVDVYALGAILFEILAGRRLFEFPRGMALAEMRRAVLEDPVPRLARVLPGCPVEVDEIVARAVHRDPADRYYSVAALGRAITRAAKGIAPSLPPPEPWKPALDAVVPGTNWRLVERLGEGGAGEVWLGQHAQLEDRLVFKFCATEEKARTLKREFTLFRLLKERIGMNAHFVRLHEVSLDEPPWYLMMDYAAARDLETWGANRPGGWGGVPEETRLEIVAQTAEALQAAHEAGILHRDIKPANLLVRDVEEATSGSGSAAVHVLVADFGIGQIVLNHLQLGERPLGFTHTVSDLQRSVLAGTMLYLAPEVLEGNPATARSDLYGLGVVFWQLLVGNLRAALDPSDWPSRITDPLLREDLHRCLAGTPEKRWASAGEFAASLRALPERRRVESLRRAEIRARERAAYRRGVARTAAIATGVILLLAASGWYAFDQARAVVAARNDARGKALRSAVSELERLAVVTTPDRHPQAAEVVRKFTARSEDERRALADAYLKVLEFDDWSLTSTPLPAASSPAPEPLDANLDAAGDCLLGRWEGGGIEWVDRRLGRRRGPFSFAGAVTGAVVLAQAPLARRAALARGNEIRLWLGWDGSEEVVLTTDRPVRALAWNSGGTELAVGVAVGEDEVGRIELRGGPRWEVTTRLEPQAGNGLLRVPDGLAYSPDDRRLAHWGSNSLHLVVWDLERREVAALAYHPGPVVTVHWCTPLQLYSTATDGLIRRWDLGEGWDSVVALDQPAGRYPAWEGSQFGPTRGWRELAVFPRADLVVAADRKAGEVFGFDRSTGRVALRFAAPARVSGLRAVGEGVVIHGRNGPLGEIRRVRSPTSRRFASSRVGKVEDFDVAEDGSGFACAGMGGVSVFDRESDERWGPSETARSLGVRFLGTHALVFSSRFGDSKLSWNGTVLAPAGPLTGGMFLTNQHNTPARIVIDGQRRRVVTARARDIRWAGLKDAEVFQIRCEADAPPEDLSVSPGGGRLVWADRQRRVWLADYERRTAELTSRKGDSVAFLDDRWCAVSGAEGSTIVNLPEGGAALRFTNLDLEQVTEIRRAPDSEVAAAALRGGGIVLGALRLEAPAQWHLLVRLAGATAGNYTRLRFAGGGRWLGAVTEGGHLQVWDLGVVLEILSDSHCLPSDFPRPPPPPSRVPGTTSLTP